MKQPSVYLKMRVLGAIDTVQGKTRHERVQNVAAMTFLDEEGQPRQFTWRTIQTWHYRYKNHGITGVTHQLSFTTLWSQFRAKIAELPSDFARFVAPGIW